MYWMLEQQPIGDFRQLATIGLSPKILGIDWYAGKHFNPKIPIPNPLKFELDPEMPGPLPWLFDEGAPLMRDGMIEALREAGVDNIDTYDVVIVDPQDGTEWDQYKAVNIIGKLAIADLVQSDFDESQPQRAITMSFDRLVLDPNKAHGLLMFRLAESVSGIVIHEKVRQQLLANEIEPLGFIKPEDWFS